MSENIDLLNQINEELTKRGLKTMENLGDHTHGQIQIVGINAIYDHSQKFFTDVKFDVIFPGGSAGQYTIRYSANGAVSDGAVIVATINGRFAIVKQWRTPLCRWTYEVPRGFGDKLDQAKIHGSLGTVKIGDLPLGTIVRELGNEVMQDAEVTSVTHLGNIASDSGTHAVTPSVFLVSLQVDESKLEHKLFGSSEIQPIKVSLWDAAKVKSEIGKKLCDTFSVASLFMALRYIEDLPKL